MAEQTMLCPKCGKKIQITAALTAQVEEKIREELKDENDRALKAKDKDWEKRLEEEKESFEKKAKREAEEKFKTELKDLKDQVSEKDEKIEEQRKEELKLRKKERELEEKAKNQEIEMAKKLDVERTRIRGDVEKKYQEESRLKEVEKDQLISSLKRANEDLTRKLEQGSQQAQGEALEIDVEATLRNTFPMDIVDPIEKGVRGADIHQNVNHENGKLCGSILWECKRQKGWSDNWITKVREDRQRVKADIALIVSDILPKDVKGFGLVEGVWISNYQNYTGLATALRSGLIRETIARNQQIGKDQKMEVLFKYLTGPEFRNRVEAMMEPFINMKEDLEKEKRAMTTAWARREKQLEKVLENTSGMYGDLQGIMGKSLPEIKTLELPAATEE
jgi:hypothetical protein